MTSLAVPPPSSCNNRIFKQQHHVLLVRSTPLKRSTQASRAPPPTKNTLPSEPRSRLLVASINIGRNAVLGDPGHQESMQTQVRYSERERVILPELPLFPVRSLRRSPEKVCERRAMGRLPRARERTCTQAGVSAPDRV